MKSVDKQENKIEWTWTMCIKTAMHCTNPDQNSLNIEHYGRSWTDWLVLCVAPGNEMRSSDTNRNRLWLPVFITQVFVSLLLRYFSFVHSFKSKPVLCVANCFISFKVYVTIMLDHLFRVPTARCIKPKNEIFWATIGSLPNNWWTEQHQQNENVQRILGTFS